MFECVVAFAAVVVPVLVMIAVPYIVGAALRVVAGFARWLVS